MVTRATWVILARACTHTHSTPERRQGRTHSAFSSKISRVCRRKTIILQKLRERRGCNFVQNHRFCSLNSASLFKSTSTSLENISQSETLQNLVRSPQLLILNLTVSPLYGIQVCTQATKCYETVNHPQITHPPTHATYCYKH